MKSRTLLCLLSLALALTARANDTSITAIGGTIVPLHHEHAFVQMVRETVHIDLHKKNYEVTVDFVFQNHGAARSVLMGFPESGGGMDKDGPLPKDAMIQNFTSTVDGVPVPVKRMAATERRDEYQAYWAKTVPFGKNQLRQVRVHYTAPYGDGLGGTLAAYSFTGGSWRGKVRESVLIVTPHPGAPVLADVSLGRKTLTPKNPRKTREYVWHNWEAEDKLWLMERHVD